MLIRQTALSDLLGIQNLYAQLNPDDPAPLEGQDRVVLKEIIKSDGLFLYVGTLGAGIVSTCYLNIIPNLSRNASAYGIIENVVTDQHYRKRGYGKLMLNHTLAHAWSSGCYKVMLQTGSKRESTHEFYKSCGFSADEKFALVARVPGEVPSSS
jgi:GNAT superfamily N-acetyltransferase